MNLSYLKHLNYEQMEAVKYNKRPLFIVAGAGTGKTMTITAKVAYLISEGMNPSQILALTFTNKAAREMRERIIEMVGPAANMSSISTFHSFGLRFLRKHISILENGLDEAFTIIDEDDAKKVVKDVIKQLDIDEKLFPTSNVYDQISAFKVGYERFYVKSDDLVLIKNAYDKYLIDNNLVDFDDLILYTLEILVKEKTIREYYQNFYQYILVDEFQDTDHLQYKILKLLLGPHNNICAVGDPDQSIYSFRGARYDNNIDYVNDYDAHVITLNKNYRSTNLILNAANNVINQNNFRYPKYENKVLSSDHGDGQPPAFLNFNSDIDEAVYVVNKVKELISFYNYKPNQIAILYRSNYLSRGFEETLIRNQVPYVVYGGISFFQRREIKDILAYVRLAQNLNANFFLKRIINVPKRKLGDVTVSKLEYHAQQRYDSMFNSIPTLDIAPATKKELMNFHKMILELNQLINNNVELPLLIDSILKITGYKDMLIAEGEDGIDRIQNVLELKGVFTRGEFLYEGTTSQKLAQMLDEISLMTDADKNVATEDKIILSSYHQVKGLEFKVVFMVAMEEGIFPSSYTFDTSAEIEEERRIAYVGITRAQHYLFLSYTNKRFRFGRIEYNAPSRFYDEAYPKQMKFGSTIKSTSQTLSYLSTGDKVEHETFGLGKVITVDNDIATIAFKAEYGIKKIIIGHPSLKKID